ncbi:hypothetical protein HY732_00605 [Candidatus Uhrbacteria bacterium]|nr:hypothetical protein [Candidatus Uhrbacteria bacterium]
MRTDRPEAITTDTLKKSYWLLQHLGTFRKNTAIFFIAIESIVILLVLVQFGGYAYYAFVREEKIVDPLRANAETELPLISIPEPSILSYGAVPHGQGQYDLYAELKNPNQGWRADFDFFYSLNGAEQSAQHVFLFPFEKKYILKTGIAAQGLPTVSYRIANLGWRRLSRADTAAIVDRNQFEIRDINLAPGQGAGGIQGGMRLTFMVQNNSVYKFWDFRVPVVLKQGATVSAVALLPVFSIDRDEKKRLEANWEYPVSASAFEIVPDIDVLQPSSLRPAL